ncbi:ATP-grasp domain-containing protein [Streptomyces albus]|uniref:ATP-grasp domain-containing protein n=1 Tax=Streptomyces albus TaxID=1888 RepID=UPI00099D6AD5|nr:ATP-grasp domain-containing protein [Streptomyces albus]
MTAARPRRVLVTGVGGAGGFDLARALMRLGCQVIAVDADPLAPGLLLPAATAATMAPAGTPHWRADLLRLCRNLQPDALISTVERELPDLLAVREPLNELGVRTWLPPEQAVRACVDKAAFAAVLREHHLPTPHTWLPHEIDQVPDKLPLVVKPRYGQGARDVAFCGSRAQARVLCEIVPDPLIQQRVTGREFTADCLVDRHGRASVILRHRLLVKGGLAVVSRTFHDEATAALVAATLDALGAQGLCCAQGFLTGDHAVMTEVNARVAGGFPLAEAAGADLVQQALGGLLDQPVNHDRLTYAPGVYLTKYSETLAAGQPGAAGGALHFPVPVEERDHPL